MRRRLRWGVLLLVALASVAALVAAMRLGLVPWRSGPSQQSAETGPAARGTPSTRRPAAHVELSGRPDFESTARPACTLHERSGLQVALRTGVAALPVVALQVDAFDGPGRYTGRLYVTARGRGGLVRSTGEGQLEVEERPLDDRRTALAGSFAGSYAGPAGSGKVRARFERCAYRSERPSAPPR